MYLDLREVDFITRRDIQGKRHQRYDVILVPLGKRHQRDGVILVPLRKRNQRYDVILEPLGKRHQRYDVILVPLGQDIAPTRSICNMTLLCVSQKFTQLIQ